SVGEVNTVAALVQAMEEEFHDWDVIISTSTNTGFSNAKKKFDDKLIFYFPLDFSWINRKVLRLLRPSCIVLVELEIWPNFLVATSEMKIPVVLVNGRISEKSQKFFKAMGFLSGMFYESLSAPGNIYCVRTQADAARFLELGIPEERVVITGTMKYDNLPVDVSEGIKEGLRHSFKLGPKDIVLVGGSTHPGEEEILLRTFKTLKVTIPTLRLIIAPRHIERAKEVEGLIKALGFSPVRKSALDKTGTFDTEPEDTVVLVDTIGDLTNIYSLADCVFVGKSLRGQGGQNIMEPAALARPTVFGPNMANFEEEMHLLLRANAAKMVRNEQELLGTIKDILNGPQYAEEIGLRARDTVLRERGATPRNLEVLKKSLKGDCR
ncbi:MAG: 3-deoxy-D-manno-octulosonic acid transferase, partial [Candidatus Brocadiales bacterium]